MSTEPVTITRRLADSPCGCGCQGDDPWHKQRFERIVSNVRDERGKRAVHAYGAAHQVKYIRTGTARLPWGEGKPVVVVEVVIQAGDKEHSLGWFSTNEVVGA